MESDLLDVLIWLEFKDLSEDVLIWLGQKKRFLILNTPLLLFHVKKSIERVLRELKRLQVSGLILSVLLSSDFGQEIVNFSRCVTNLDFLLLLESA